MSSTMLLFASLIVAFALLSFPNVANAAFASCATNRTYAASADKLDKMRLRMYDGSIDRPIDVPILEAAKLMNKIEKPKPTIVIIHGWQQNEKSLNLNVISEAFLSRNCCNVIVLLWVEISRGEYIYAARSAEGIGCYVAQMLNVLVASGMRKDLVTLVGHSLGAQICGFAGRKVNFELNGIWGLDPAGLGFNPTTDFDLQHLTSGDGKFVFIIHTDRGRFGTDDKLGDADFYPNDGKSLQPGCSIFLIPCSHGRSYLYFAESVKNGKAFIGRKCDSDSKFKAGLCRSEETVVMGYDTPPNTRGNFYLQTNGKSPYGRGENGATYRNRIL